MNYSKGIDRNADKMIGSVGPVKHDQPNKGAQGLNKDAGKAPVTSYNQSTKGAQDLNKGKK